jgi:hypothetical protein
MSLPEEQAHAARTTAVSIDRKGRVGFIIEVSSRRGTTVPLQGLWGADSLM